MSNIIARSRPAQGGMVLVSSLLLLLVVTILAVGMFRSFGMQEKIAGNVREKQRALHAAETAQQYAEWWLTSSNMTGVINCSGLLIVSTPGQGEACQNKLTDLIGNVAGVPWQRQGQNLGVSYTPPLMSVATQATSGTTYYAPPRFYISFLGVIDNGMSNIYQIDAMGYGGSPDAVAVVESTYMVSVTARSGDNP
jgi:type IV pilus assembly protein PilX